MRRKPCVPPTLTPQFQGHPQDTTGTSQCLALPAGKISPQRRATNEMSVTPNPSSFGLHSPSFLIPVAPPENRDLAPGTRWGQAPPGSPVHAAQPWGRGTGPQACFSPTLPPEKFLLA